VTVDLSVLVGSDGIGLGGLVKSFSARVQNINPWPGQSIVMCTQVAYVI
jgi:hypothetical protein